MPQSLRPFLHSDDAYVASPAPMSPPTRARLDTDQQRFVDRALSRWTTVRQTVRDHWVTSKPAPLRSKTVDFSEVDALHRRWVQQNRPAHGEAANRFHRRAVDFLFNNDRERQTRKLERDRDRTRDLLGELRDARSREHRSRSTSARHGNLATLLAACFPCLSRRPARRRAEASIRRRYAQGGPGNA